MCSVPGKAVDSAYLVDVLNRLSIPSTIFAVKALSAWVPYENTNACWNPFATTRPAEGSTPFNTFACGSATGECHVQNYVDRSTGAAATAKTLANGYYDSILRLLGRQSFDAGALRDALCVWAGGCEYADPLIRDWRSLWSDPAVASLPAPLSAHQTAAPGPAPAPSAAATPGPAAAPEPSQPSESVAAPVEQEEAPVVNTVDPSLPQRLASWFLGVLGRIRSGFGPIR